MTERTSAAIHFARRIMKAFWEDVRFGETTGVAVEVRLLSGERLIKGVHDVHEEEGFVSFSDRTGSPYLIRERLPSRHRQFDDALMKRVVRRNASCRFSVHRTDASIAIVLGTIGLFAPNSLNTGGRSTPTRLYRWNRAAQPAVSRLDRRRSGNMLRQNICSVASLNVRGSKLWQRSALPWFLELAVAI
jgi:hypothetical protein